MNEPLQTILTCPACASLDIDVEDTLDSYTDFNSSSTIYWSIGHCRACGKNFSFEEVYKFAGFRNIELEEN